MIPDAIETAKDAMLRTFAAQLRMERPGLTHARSFQLAQEQHPELREEWPDEQPSSMPADYPGSPGNPAEAQAKLDSLLSQLYKPKRQRIEAKKPRSDDAELMLVEAAQRGDAMPVYSKSGVLLGEVYFD